MKEMGLMRTRTGLPKLALTAGLGLAPAAAYGQSGSQDHRIPPAPRPMPAHQAVRGGTGAIVPGRFFGSGVAALDAEQVAGPGTYQAGFGISLGWRFGEGSWIEALEFRWRHLAESKYSAVASFIPGTFKIGDN